MKAVIIAAGKGTRINKGKSEAYSKPLHKLFKKMLIETVIINLEKAGIKDIAIVTGFQADRIKKELGEGSKYGVKITYLYNGEYEKPLGISVLKAKQYVGNEDFILSMSDHVFQPEIVKEFVNIKKEKDTCVLCIDRKINHPDSLFDLEDAAKVLTKENKIIDIGKKIEKYNAVDCGIFYLSPIFFDALEKAREKGDEHCTNSEAAKILADKGKMFVHDLGNRIWIDVDTQEDYSRAKKKFGNMF